MHGGTEIFFSSQFEFSLPMQEAHLVKSPASNPANIALNSLENHDGYVWLASIMARFEATCVFYHLT